MRPAQLPLLRLAAAVLARPPLMPHTNLIAGLGHVLDKVLLARSPISLATKRVRPALLLSTQSLRQQALAVVHPAQLPLFRLAAAVLARPRPMPNTSLIDGLGHATVKVLRAR